MGEVIATLGSNPLPIVVSALTRKATKLHLVMTSQVEPLGERIWTLLEDAGRATAGKHVVARGERIIVSDGAAGDVARLRSELSHSNVPWPSADLDYTGGTKLMSAEVRAWWREQNGTGTSSYLTEKGRLVWGRPPGDPGPAWSPAEASLSFQELARLHFEHPLKAGDSHGNEQLGAAADRILGYVREFGFAEWMKLLPSFRPSTVEKDGIVYQEANALPCRKNFADDAPLMQSVPSAALRIVGLGASIDEVAFAIGASGTKNEKRVDALKWLEGDWLEIAFSRLLEDTKLFDEVHQDLKQEGKAKGDAFQVDVVGVKGHRAYLFTCTTMDRASNCKHKLFEGAHRAARLGGEYARVALVSLMAQPHEAVRAVREDGWEGYDQFRSFGLPHLKQGGQAATSVDASGKEGPSQSVVDALKAWLEA
jgi:hypothetical protein